MSKSKLRNLIFFTIATLCLIATPLTTQAAGKTEADQSDKDRLVLLPLQADEIEKNMRARMETALFQGLVQQYEVLPDRRVIQSLKKASGKNNQAARKKGCDETSCLKQVAKDLHAEIFATVRVTKTEDGYSLSLDIKNIMTNQVMFQNAIQCKGCDQSQVVDRLWELSGAPALVATIPDAMPDTVATTPPHPLQPGNVFPGEIFRDCANCPDMVVIPAGAFDMGSASSGEKDEKPEHRVTINQPFAMGKIEITRGQFAAFVSASGYDAGDKCLVLAGDKWEKSGDNNWRNPGYPQDDSHPVACVDWIDAQAYVKWLSQQTGKHYQLPTESEWEYACRAGGQLEYCGSDNADSVAWYDHNSGNTTHPAGAKQANDFGLYDMSGNVGEWVEDSYHDRYNDEPGDGSAWDEDSTKRVLRGGSWIYSQTGERSAFRSVSSPWYRYFDTGFRVVRTLP